MKPNIAGLGSKRRMQFRNLSSSALLASVLLCGCKSGPVEHLAELGSPTLLPGWTDFADPESGASIGIAPGWTEGTGLANDMPMSAPTSDGSDLSQKIDPNSSVGQLTQKMGALVDKQTDELEQRARERLRKNGVVINVTDGSKSTIGEQRTRYYVKVVKHDSPISLEVASAEERHHFLQPGDGADVTLPVGKAHRYEVETTMITGDKQFQISYVLVDGSDTYLIRFISTNAPDVFKTIERPVAESFRLIHKK